MLFMTCSQDNVLGRPWLRLTAVLNVGCRSTRFLSSRPTIFHIVVLVGTFLYVSLPSICELSVYCYVITLMTQYILLRPI